MAKGLVRPHGGRLDVNSAGAGLGSKFMIGQPRSLIVDDEETERDIPAKAHSASKKRLIADDNVDAAESLGMLLELSVHHVHAAHSHREAFDSAQKKSAG